MTQEITLHNGTIHINCGEITSDLEREVCPACGQELCCFNCDGSQSGAYESEGEVADRLRFNGALDALESMLFAAAMGGFITTSEDPKWNKIIDTVLDAIGNNL